MNIDYKKFPALLYLNGIGKIKIHEFDFLNSKEITLSAQFIIDENIQYFKNEITYVSKPFHSACAAAKKNMDNLWIDIQKNKSEPIEINGVYLIHKTTIFIRFHYDNILDKSSCKMMGFTDLGMLAFYRFDNYDSDFGGEWISKGIDTEGERELYTYSWLLSIIAIHLFKKYAQVETKLMPANTITGIPANRIHNNTKNNVLFLDSKWFTTLVKSDGFKVSGHFRLQPKKKDGEWTKELIWINEFQKDGYTSKARILKN